MMPSSFPRALATVMWALLSFLVDQLRRHYFIEINPCIQVKHTITGGNYIICLLFHVCTNSTAIFSEEIMGIDIVAVQIQIITSATLLQLGLSQEAITRRASAIHYHITTEDAAASFQLDTGKIEV